MWPETALYGQILLVSEVSFDFSSINIFGTKTLDCCKLVATAELSNHSYRVKFTLRAVRSSTSVCLVHC